MAVFACYATMIMLGVTLSLLGPSLPALAERIGVTLPQAGVFFSLFSGGSVAATLLVARLNDRPVRHLVLVAGALLMGAGHWLLAGSSTFAQAGLTVTLTGLAMSAVGTAPNAIMGDIYRGRAGQGLNLLHIFAGAGAFAGPLMLSAALRLGDDYRAVYRAAAVLMLLVAALWALSLPPRPQPAQRPRGGSLSWLRPLLLVFALALLYTGTEVAVGGWLFTYARSALGQDPPAASLAASFLWLAILLGRLAASRALARISSSTLLRACVLGAAAGLGGVLLGQLWEPLFWAGVVGAGFCFGPIFPTALGVSHDLAAGRGGAASSLVVAAGSLGAMALPWAAGALMPAIGIAGSLAALFAPLALMLICQQALARRLA